jgi:hypothetical protein
MQWFVDNLGVLLLLVGQLLATAAIIVKLTPSTTDDEWLAKITELFNRVNPPKQ